jgi:ribosomal protein S24E
MSEIKVVGEKYNELLRRKEISLLIDHDGSATPKRFDVRKGLAGKYGVVLDSCFVTKLETLTGTRRTVGVAEIYDDPSRAKLVVPKHIRTRNLPPEEAVKLKEQKAAAEPKKKAKAQAPGKAQAPAKAPPKKA